jgi:hypothetical protein
MALGNIKKITAVDDFMRATIRADDADPHGFLGIFAEMEQLNRKLP